MTEWEPATETEAAMRDALRANDQESYFRILARTELLLPVSAQALAGRVPMGWGTWTTGGRTHVLAFTSVPAVQACLAENAGATRRTSYRDLADSWPNHEWWLAVNPGLPIEGYLPAWFVAQLARGDVRLPGRTIGARARLEQVESVARARATAAVPGHVLPAAQWGPASPQVEPAGVAPAAEPSPAFTPAASAPYAPPPVPLGASHPATLPGEPVSAALVGPTSEHALAAWITATASPPLADDPSGGRLGHQPGVRHASTPTTAGRATEAFAAGRAAQAGGPGRTSTRPGRFPLAGTPAAPGNARAAGDGGIADRDQTRPTGAPGTVTTASDWSPFHSRESAGNGTAGGAATRAGSVGGGPVPAGMSGAGMPPPARPGEPDSGWDGIIAGPSEPTAGPSGFDPGWERTAVGQTEFAAGRGEASSSRSESGWRPTPASPPLASRLAAEPPGNATRSESTGSTSAPMTSAPAAPVPVVPTPAAPVPGMLGPISPEPAVRRDPAGTRDTNLPAEPAAPARRPQPPPLFTPSQPARATEPPPPFIRQETTPAGTRPDPPPPFVPQRPAPVPPAAATAVTPVPGDTPAPATAPPPMSAATPAPAVAPGPAPASAPPPPVVASPASSVSAAPPSAPSMPSVAAPPVTPAPRVAAASPGTTAPPSPGTTAPPLPFVPIVPSAAEQSGGPSSGPAAPAARPAGGTPGKEFTPANDVERGLLAATAEGDTDRYLSTLLLAKVLLPVSHVSASGARPGEEGFSWRTETIDGVTYVVVFTSPERLTEHLDAAVETVTVKFVQLIQQWPKNDWSFAVNPGTPVGARFPGNQIVALANWAAEVGLGGETDSGAEGDGGAPESGRTVPVPATEAVPAPRSGYVPVREDPGQPTMMQKTVAPNQIDYYLDRGYDRVSGFVHRAGEIAHLDTPAKLYAALGLGHPGSPFARDAAEVYVLRWPAYRPSLYRIPYGGQNEAAMRAMEGWVIERSPFRGNGFAPGENSDVVAEFKVDSIRLPHSSRLCRLGADGTETLLAVLDADARVWRRVTEE